MLDEGKPDLVVMFPGHRGTSDMRMRAKLARVAWIMVAADGTMTNREGTAARLQPVAL
jgi:hypothetical protein